MFNLTSSLLDDQTTFYKAFHRDLEKAKTRVIIESPFITEKRMKLLIPTLMALRHKDVCMIVNTKPLEEHSLSYKSRAIQFHKRHAGIRYRSLENARSST